VLFQPPAGGETGVALAPGIGYPQVVCAPGGVVLEL
jgi:hypothetical protein